jgi:hypothetical protein
MVEREYYVEYPFSTKHKTATSIIHHTEMKLPVLPLLRLLDPFQHQAALVILFVISSLGTYYPVYHNIAATSTAVVQAFGFSKFHTRTISPSGCARPTTTTTSITTTRIVPLFRTAGARCTTVRTTTSFGRIYRNQAAASDSNNDYDPNDSSSDGNRSDKIENMRHYLESSWNIQNMGRVPSTPQNAAEAAGKKMTHNFFIPA